ncbi:MAG: HAMP domain-containing histidine kinase [Spirosomaceae bacterium]|jgi:two-component system phosphate regulon sensor histidine kinase PhoR|nr:HAMP domain-containing histidine kinase [Spirosomataceae bacterium]
MTKRKIQFIIGLISLAMLCLVGFQWYWISNAIELRNEQFSLKVTDALQEVVRKLEKQEIVYLIRQREQIEQQQKHLETLQKNRLARRAKSPQQRLPDEYAQSSQNPNREVVPSQDGANHSDALLPRNRPMTDFQSSLINDFLSHRTTELPQIERFLKIHQQQERIFNEWFDQINSSFYDSDTLPPSLMLSFRAVPKKPYAAFSKPATRVTSEKQPNTTEMLRSVFKDLLFSKRPVEQRVSRLMLDSLLKKAFQERGIGIGYEFALQNNPQNNVLFSTTAYRTDTRPQELYKATLFPNEINQSLSQLAVYFPDREGFVLRNMTLPLASSGLLLAVILGCFYVAVSTIVKQKKLADVKNDFINNMTHEFKTPISTIHLAVGMAQEQAPADPQKIGRYLNIIHDENQRLSGHVEKVLQMALLERGEIRLKKTPIHLHDLLDKVLNSFSVQMEQREAELVLEFEADNDLLEADEGHLTNVLSNLVDNALKYSPQRPHLSISTQSTDTDLFLQVSDRGIGMNTEQQAKIFEAFYRVPTGNIHDVKGFGLGLSYVKKMIEAHGGSIEVQSKIGEGSTFSVKIPVGSKR